MKIIFEFKQTVTKSSIEHNSIEYTREENTIEDGFHMIVWLDAKGNKVDKELKDELERKFQIIQNGYNITLADGHIVYEEDEYYAVCRIDKSLHGPLIMGKSAASWYKGVGWNYFKNKESAETFLSKLENPPLDFPIVKNVNAKTIADDIQPVYPAKPSQPYTGVFEIKESKMPRTISGYHPYSVNETNIEETKELFNYDDVQIGDNVEEWDMGGWGALAGRAGISLMRNGVELKSKLTMMS